MDGRQTAQSAATTSAHRLRSRSASAPMPLTACRHMRRTAGRSGDRQSRRSGHAVLVEAEPGAPAAQGRGARPQPRPKRRAGLRSPRSVAGRAPAGRRRVVTQKTVPRPIDPTRNPSTASARTAARWRKPKERKTHSKVVLQEAHILHIMLSSGKLREDAPGKSDLD